VPFVLGQGKLLNLFLNLRSLTNAVTQIVKLCAANLCHTDYINLCHVGRMEGEGLLHTDTVGNASYGKVSEIPPPCLAITVPSKS